MFRPLLFAVLALLAGCVSLVPATVARLMTVDPLTADPGQLRVAVTLPPGLMVLPGSAQLTIEGSIEGEKIAEKFVLVQVPMASDGFDLPTGYSGSVFSLSKADTVRLVSLQERIVDGKSKDPDHTGGRFSVNTLLCGAGSMVPEDAPFSILIRLKESASYMPLVRDANLRRTLGNDAIDALKPCETRQ
jgi:hypothetical protein